MNYLEDFYSKTLQHDLVNKYFLKKTKSIPILKKLVLNFNFWSKPFNLKLFTSSMLALEFIAYQAGVLTKTSSSNLSLRLRKGSPIGCKLTLKKENKYIVLSKIIQEASPSGKTFVLFKPNHLKNAFSLDIFELFSFNELEKQYNIFTDLTPLNITLVLNTESLLELEFLLKSLQLPLTSHV